MFIDFLMFISAVVFALDFIVGTYMLPWIIATQRDTVNQDAILVFNLLLGWTIVMWLILLVWAMFGAIWVEDEDSELDSQSASTYK